MEHFLILAENQSTSDLDITFGPITTSFHVQDEQIIYLLV